MKMFLALFCLCATGFARVGEPYATFLQSTGFENAAIDTELPGLKKATHVRDGVTAIIMIWRGEICAEQYNDATTKQVSELMLRQGTGWKRVADGVWTNENGLRARFRNGELLIASEDGQKIVAAYQDKLAAIKERKQAETLKGF